MESEYGSLTCLDDRFASFQRAVKANAPLKKVTHLVKVIYG